MLLPEIITELELDLDIRMKDPESFSPIEGGGGLVMWRDPAKRHEEISRFSKKDADAYPKLRRALRRGLSHPCVRCFVTPLRANRRDARSGAPRSRTSSSRTVDGSIAELCEEYFETDLMQGLMASQGIIGSAAGPRTPGSAYVYLHHAFGEAGGEPGVWGFVRGGMGAITAALADVLRAWAERSGWRPRSRASSSTARRVGGVVLESGEEIDAPAVLSNADPKRTLSFFDPKDLAPEYVTDVGAAPDRWNGRQGELRAQRAPALHGDGRRRRARARASRNDHDRSVDRLPREGVRPGGRGGAGRRVSSARHGSRPRPSRSSRPKASTRSRCSRSTRRTSSPTGTWDERRDEIADRVIASIERYAPGLSDLIEDRLVLGPPDLESRFGLTGGNIFHGEILPGWIFDDRALALVASPPAPASPGLTCAAPELIRAAGCAARRAG